MLGRLTKEGNSNGTAQPAPGTPRPGRRYNCPGRDQAHNTSWFACFLSGELLPSGSGTDRSPEAVHSPAAEILGRLYRDWPPEVGRVLGNLDGNPVDCRELSDIPRLPSYVFGRTALLGDAAHGMAPNLAGVPAKRSWVPPRWWKR